MDSKLEFAVLFIALGIIMMFLLKIVVAGAVLMLLGAGLWKFLR